MCSINNIWCVSILILSCFSIFCSKTVKETGIYLDRTLEGLQAALQFFDREYTSLNLDAVISTKATEGQLRVLERKIKRKSNLWNTDPITIKKISKLRRLSGDVTKKAIPHQILSNPTYYHTFSPSLKNGFWELDNESRILPPSDHIWPYHDDELLDGPTSNGCIGEILGTLGKSPCDISPPCWRIMTASGYYGYSLSHQLLYSMMGQMNGCSRQMEKYRVRLGLPDIDRLQAELCTSMLTEVQMIANRSYPWFKRDLFMEDAAFCGILGFRQFFRYSWLEYILSWQNPQNGCYDTGHIFDGQIVIKLTPHTRRKRSERLLKNGCLSHLTAMAICSLTQYVRYLLEALVI